MTHAAILDHLSGLGGDKWEVHERARAMQDAGRDVTLLTVGEPDVPAPESLIDAACTAMRAGRTGYSNGRGEPALLEALAARYSARLGRPVGTDQFLCFPGTQTALFAVLMGLAGPDSEVLVGDPMYATYEGLIRASGARMVPVPLRPEAGFRMSADDISARLTPRSRVILLNTPHNPTGAVLRASDLAEIGALARERDLWIVADEVYEELIHGDIPFASALADPALEERVVIASSLSKSHAATGFRSGWCAGSREVCERLLPLAETMLFGNQPFIADATAAALSAPSPVAAGMRERLGRRARMVAERLGGAGGLRVHRPEAGMFALVDVRASGLAGDRFAAELLERTGVAVMPGTSFGETLTGWIRLGLTVPDDVLANACDAIADFAGARVHA